MGLKMEGCAKEVLTAATGSMRVVLLIAHG